MLPHIRNYQKTQRWRKKDKISAKLNQIHTAREITYATHRKLLPTMTQIPTMYGQPKVHKEGYPLREIVDGNNSITKW